VRGNGRRGGGRPWSGCGGFLEERQVFLDVARAAVGEAWLQIRHSRQVERQSQAGDDYIDCCEGLDASSALKGLVAQVRAVCKV